MMLNLYNNEISDITPLEGLVKLRRLVIGDNNISDFEPLKEMSRLVTLRMDGGELTSLDFLKNIVERGLLKYSGIKCLIQLGANFLRFTIYSTNMG